MFLNSHVGSTRLRAVTMASAGRLNLVRASIRRTYSRRVLDPCGLHRVYRYTAVTEPCQAQSEYLLWISWALARIRQRLALFRGVMLPALTRGLVLVMRDGWDLVE